jgi:Holliday junction resolvase RusA-like endonuclease
MTESTFKVTIPGPPQAWQRPRFEGRSRRVYSPARLEQWYDAAALAIWPLWSLSSPLDGPLRVAVDVVTQRPKSLPAALKSLGWTAAKRSGGRLQAASIDRPPLTWTIS